MQYAELWICCVDTLTLELMQDHEYMRGFERVCCNIGCVEVDSF